MVLELLTTFYVTSGINFVMIEESLADEVTLVKPGYVAAETTFGTMT